MPNDVNNSVDVIVTSFACLVGQAGTVYRWVMIEAATMKWMHLSFDQPGCVMGLYSRDATLLSQIPRLTDNIVFSAANRQVQLVFQWQS